MAVSGSASRRRVAQPDLGSVTRYVAAKLAPCLVRRVVRTVTVAAFFFKAVRVALLTVQVRVLVPFALGVAVARQMVAPVALVVSWVMVEGPVVLTCARMRVAVALGLRMASSLYGRTAVVALEAVPVPPAERATTVIVYAVVFSRPVIVHVTAPVVVHVAPPGLAVAVYPVIPPPGDAVAV